jgi:hypothetical protein
MNNINHIYNSLICEYCNKEFFTENDCISHKHMCYKLKKITCIKCNNVGHCAKICNLIC